MTPLVRRGSLLLALTAVSASASLAQERQVLRPERTLFIAPHIGFAAYVGDHDVNPFDGGYFQGTSGEELPIRYGGQIGYQFSPYVAASVGGAIGNYTTIWRDVNGGVFNNFNRRYTADALVRLTAGAQHARFAPYVEIGVRGSNGETNPPGGGTDAVQRRPAARRRCRSRGHAASVVPARRQLRPDVSRRQHRRERLSPASTASRRSTCSAGLA